MRLCEAPYRRRVPASMADLLHLVAHHDQPPEALAALQRGVPDAPTRAHVSGPGDPGPGRRARSRTSLADAEYSQGIGGRETQWRSPARRPDASRDGTPIGASSSFGGASQATFTDRQIELAEDLRRPGRHRHRERAPVHGARGAQQRAAGRARAADRDQRAAQGDRAVHVRSPAGLRDAGRERGPAVRGRARVRSSASTVRCCESWPRHNVSPELRAFVEQNPDRARTRQRRGARRPRAAHASTSTMSRPTPSTPTAAQAGRPHPDRAARSPCSGRTSCSA